MEEEKSNLKWILIFIGIFLLLVSMVINYVTYLRIFLNIIGVIILVIATVIQSEIKPKFVLLYFFLYLVIAILLDTVVVINFNRLPVYSYNIITSNESRVLNALGYRVWDCKGKALKVDRFYKLGYYCDASEMEAVEANAFLSEVVENFDEYKNEYFKISGKISSKDGSSYIEMQPYKSNEITINGYVNFSDNITLRALFNSTDEDIVNYEIYDSITIIGKVWHKKEENNKYVIYMEDTKIVNNETKDSYQIIASENPTCNNEKILLYSGADYNLYSKCLNNIIIKYDEKNIYELSSLLSSGKIKITSILEKAKEEKMQESDGTKLYIYDDFRILKCNENAGSNIIVGKDVDFSNTFCSFE